MQAMLAENDIAIEVLRLRIKRFGGIQSLYKLRCCKGSEFYNEGVFNRKAEVLSFFRPL